MVLLCVVTLVWIGCGGTGANRDVPTAFGVREPTRAAAYRSFANAVNLRSSDVPGFLDSHGHESSGGLDGACGLPGPAKIDFEADSPLFTAKEDAEVVESAVEVIASAKANRAEFDALKAALHTGRGRTCIAALYDLTRHYSHQGEEVHYTHSHASLIPDQLGDRSPTGSPAIAYSVRYLAAITRRRGSVIRHFLVHSERTLVFILVGRASITLYTGNFDEPFPLTLEGRLVSLIQRRALAAARLYPEIEN